MRKVHAFKKLQVMATFVLAIAAALALSFGTASAAGGGQCSAKPTTCCQCGSYGGESWCYETGGGGTYWCDGIICPWWESPCYDSPV